MDDIKGLSEAEAKWLEPPAEIKACEKCDCVDADNPITVTDESTDKVVYECDCICHMSEADIEAMHADQAYDEWKDMQDQGRG